MFVCYDTCIGSCIYHPFPKELPPQTAACRQHGLSPKLRHYPSIFHPHQFAFSRMSWKWDYYPTAVWVQCPSLSSVRWVTHGESESLTQPCLVPSAVLCMITLQRVYPFSSRRTYWLFPVWGDYRFNHSVWTQTSTSSKPMPQREDFVSARYPHTTTLI